MDESSSARYSLGRAWQTLELWNYINVMVIHRSKDWICRHRYRADVVK